MAEHKQTTENKQEQKMKEKQKEVAETKPENQKIEKETKKEDKGQEKKEKIVARPKKDYALVNGRNLPFSTKQGVAICSFIRNKDIDLAISDLGQVVRFKRPVPMKGEIPHRKGRIMSGRYPVKASREFMKLLRSLKANAIADELELEKFSIACKANVASRPVRRFGRSRFKRTHVEIRLVPITKKTRVMINKKRSEKEDGEAED